MKMKLVVIGTILVLLSSLVLFAQTDSIPEPLCGHTMVFVNDPYIFLFGGDQDSRAVINELWAYNKDNSQWEKKESDNPPPRRHRHASVKNNDKMITFFGRGLSGLLSDIWQYDIPTDTWTELPSGGASLPEAREYHSATTIGDYVYFGGGLDSNGLGKSDFWKYHLETGIWTQIAEHPGACAGHGAFHHNGLFYVFGGYEPEYSSYRNDIWCYDPAANSWDFVNAGGDSPSERAFFAAVQDMMGNLLIFGGRNETRTIAMSDNYKFDVSTSTWTQLADGPAISDAAAVYVNETSIYLFGGLNEFGNATNDLWKYNPSNDTWEEIVGINGPEIIAPSRVSLFAYPNPFNPTTKIKYELKMSGYIELIIFNIKGELVSTLVKDYQNTGNHSVIWNGDDDKSSSVSSGVYLYKLNVNGKTEAKNKCLLLK
ncbi:MAG: T9SS type A sorting domain-containing protein [Candidatus Cloacimonetes bacterium]|nr:T9SS type A sorting domain-containing protein [Candidatus Cloacimonadota bacterium]